MRSLLLGSAICAAAATPLSWEEAQAKADEMLSQMTMQQKYKLMRGIGWHMYDLQPGYYVGTTESVPELGIPGQKFFDASGGFRTIFPELVGTVTCWPSLLAMAATWDPEVVETFAGALAHEFRGKGANGILGPGVNVARVARNGRNFEYISGEDPYLGSQLAAAYVRGAQNNGVMTVVKHYSLNHEEAHRDDGSSNADDKTVWELYYPPYQSAIDAGVTATMCGYNLEDGVHSCSNQKTLQSMKVGMNFNGFIQSDWWATHETSVAAGLDQMQPTPLCCEDNATYRSVHWFDDEHLSNVSADLVDASARRILSSMYKIPKVFEDNKCEPPNCGEQLNTTVTNEHHAQIARKGAAESIVLLKNEGVLPISKSVKTLAIVGFASASPPFNPANPNQGSGDWSTGDYYAGGGSGHTTAGYVVTAFDGISKRAEANGIKVTNSSTDNVTAAVALAQEADLTIVVGGTSSGESKDRPNLHLDGDVDRLIEAVAGTRSNVIVLTQICGSILMPWKDQVEGIASLFLGGQETGSAWGDVLFGDHAPTGRLPVMIPASEADHIPPADSTVIAYSEGMSTSYRNPNFKSAFPFGHGLTYTTFEYSAFNAKACDDAICIVGHLKNTGMVSARTTPQLYLEFPEEAEFPTPVLKGFHKTQLIYPGATAKVEFRLTKRDMSYFDGLLDDGYSPRWTQVSKATAHIGDSSADIKQKVDIDTSIVVV